MFKCFSDAARIGSLVLLLAAMYIANGVDDIYLSTNLPVCIDADTECPQSNKIQQYSDIWKHNDLEMA